MTKLILSLLSLLSYCFAQNNNVDHIPNCDVENIIVARVMDTNRMGPTTKVFIDSTLNMRSGHFKNYQKKHELEIVNESNNKVLSKDLPNEFFSYIPKEGFEFKVDYWGKANWIRLSFSPIFTKDEELYIQCAMLSDTGEQAANVYSFSLDTNCEIVNLEIVDGYFKSLCPK